MGDLLRYATAFRNGDANAQHTAWRTLDQTLDHIIARIGKIPIEFIDDPTPDPQSPLRGASPKTPPAAFFTVTGVDGKFIISIQNPQNLQAMSPALRAAFVRSNNNPHRAIIVHNLQSCSDINFDNSSASFTDYGISPQLVHTYQNPNQTLFWRLRSSYDGKTWNAWQIYSSALTCGPVGVQSGLMRSPSMVLNAPTNSGNNCTVDSIDAGTSATVRIYGPGGVGSSWQHRGSNQSGGGTTDTTYPAGQIPGAGYNTKYWVMYNQSLAAYQFFFRYADAVADTLVFVGVVTTVAAGGGGGSSGGGGSNFGNGGCVEIGTPVEFPEGSEVEESIEPCSDWIGLRVGGREILNVHPDTLVCVFKRAHELQTGDRIEVDDNGNWEPLIAMGRLRKDSHKVVRRVRPGGKYKARGIWLHNIKFSTA